MLIESLNPVKTINQKPSRLPKVSVCVVTYNQARYIRRCLQSIVDQETDFEFEIIVGDDCSTDGTQDILRDFERKYPNLFRVILHPKNIGASFNYAKTHELAVGEYVAHMDGDDSMLPGKLQKQVTVFSKNPDCVIVTHDMQVVDADDLIRRHTFRRHKSGINTLLDLYEALPFFAHSSKMVKGTVDSAVLPMITAGTLDIELHVAMVEYGNIYHIDEALGSYRLGVGISSAGEKSVAFWLIDGSQRIYESAFVKHPEWRGRLKKYYAKAMLNYAYQAAICEDRDGFNKLVWRSVGISCFSFLQVAFLLLPTTMIFALVRYRNKLRFGKENRSGGGVFHGEGS